MDGAERLLKEIFSPSHTEGGLRLVWTAWNLYNLLLVRLSSADSPGCFLLFYIIRVIISLSALSDRETGTALAPALPPVLPWSNPSLSAAH